MAKGKKPQSSGFDSAIGEKIVQALECGLSREQAAHYAGIGAPRLEDWFSRGRSGVAHYSRFLSQALEAEARSVLGPLAVLQRAVMSDRIEDRKMAVDVAKFLVNRADNRESRREGMRLAKGVASLELAADGAEEATESGGLVIDAESFTVEEARRMLALEDKSGEELVRILSDE